MYEAVPDPYCYPGTTVLKNIPGLRSERALEDFEAAITAQRADEPLPAGRFSALHYRAIHRHLFQDVYRWAGRYRTVRISKGDSVFCYPENIAREMAALFSELRTKRFFAHLSSGSFASEGAHFLAALNAIHPFRDGNGRSQLAFLALLASRSGHPLALRKLNPEEFLQAMIASFHGDERHLVGQIQALTTD